METRKILTVIFSMLIVSAFAFVLTWGIINFNKVKEGLSGTGVYTETDINNAYTDGYNTAMENKEEYDVLIANYRDTITTLNDTISQLSNQVTNLQKTNTNYESLITELTELKEENESTIDNLEQQIISNDTTINELNNTIDELEAEIAVLEAQATVDADTITTLKSQVSTYKSLSEQLQEVNSSNLDTISNLNAQIITLNTRITELSNQISDNSSTTSELNLKISQLESTIDYYESYIKSLQSENTAVVTFMYEGSVFNIQVVSIGTTVSLTDPETTDYIVFNGWTLDGDLVDLSKYTITKSVTFTADVDYNYATNFMSNGELYLTQIVAENGYPTTPVAPSLSGYEFDGWSLNGVDIVDVTTIQITETTTFYAVYTKLNTVSFSYNGEIIDTETVRYNEYASERSVEDTDYILFNGWTIDGETIIDVTDYPIIADTVFIANLTYCYDVTFYTDDTIYATQIVAENGYATLPTDPTKDGYDFDGWTLNTVDVIDMSNYKITANTIIYAKFTQLFTVQFYVNDDLYDTQTIRSGETASSPSVQITGCDLAGWSLDGETIIDLDSYSITKDTELIAIFSSYQYWTGEFDYSFYNETTEWHIYTAEQLAGFLNLCNGTDYTYTYDVEVYIENDIYLNSSLYDLTDIDSLSESEIASLNNWYFDWSNIYYEGDSVDIYGQGHTIYGMYQNITSGYSGYVYTGLFCGMGYDGTEVGIHNLNLENSYIYVNCAATRFYIGSFAGSCYCVNKCSTDCVIDVICTSFSRGYLGGIAGYSDSSLFNCNFTGVVTATLSTSTSSYVYIGGIGGAVDGNTNYSSFVGKMTVDLTTTFTSGVAYYGTLAGWYGASTCTNTDYSGEFTVTTNYPVVYNRFEYIGYWDD